MSSPQAPALPHCYRFGPFEADLRKSELRKFGLQIRLERKPWQLLLALLEHPGELVTRAELERRLWGEGVFVDFEHGVNVAVKKVREALCDSAEMPRYVETVFREGYRFMGEVELLPTATLAMDSLLPRMEPRSDSVAARTKLWMRWALVSGLAVLLLVAVSSRTNWPGRGAELVAERLTSNAPGRGLIASSISPDGRYLAYVTVQGIWVKQNASGEVHRLVVEPPLVPIGVSWYNDSSTLLATDRTGVWRLSALGGNAQRIFGPAHSARVSPDGRWLAVTAWNRRSISVADSTGENARPIASLPSGVEGYFSNPTWSPQGKRLAYMKHWEDARGMGADIETVRQDGSDPHIVLKKFPIMQIHWVRDGRVLFGVGNPPPNTGTTNLWSVAVDEESGQARSPAQALTAWPDFSFWGLSSTSDGRTVAFLRMSPQSNVLTAELAGGASQLGEMRQVTFGGPFQYNYPGAWDPADQDLLIVVKTQGRNWIVRQRLDGTDSRPAVPDSERAQFMPQFSADGRWLLWLRAARDWSSAEVMRMPRGGGLVEVLDRQPGTAFYLRCPMRSGLECIFSSLQGDQTVFRAVTVDSVASRELFRWRTPRAGLNYDVAPHGDRMLVCEAEASPSPNEGVGKVYVVGLPGGLKERELPLGCPANIISLRWTPDGKGWLMSRILLPNASEVLYVDESGTSRVLLQNYSQRIAEPTLSPDGRRVAFVNFTSDTNAWALRF